MPFTYNFAPNANYFYQSQQSTGASPTGTTIAISGGVAIPPYVNATSQSPTNSPTWQMFYANQNVTFSGIRQYTYLNGTNSWNYYIAKAPSAESQNFASATVTLIGAQGLTSYTSGGVTNTTLSSAQTVDAGYYFLVGCVVGPFYKTFNTGTSNYVFTSSGVPKVTMINKSYWRNHGAADQTMNIPTQLGGAGTYNAPANTIWCIGLTGVS